MSQTFLQHPPCWSWGLHAPLFPDGPSAPQPISGSSRCSQVRGRSPWLPPRVPLDTVEIHSSLYSFCLWALKELKLKPVTFILKTSREFQSLSALGIHGVIHIPCLEAFALIFCSLVKWWCLTQPELFGYVHNVDLLLSHNLNQVRTTPISFSQNQKSQDGENFSDDLAQHPHFIN